MPVLMVVGRAAASRIASASTSQSVTVRSVYSGTNRLRDEDMRPRTRGVPALPWSGPSRFSEVELRAELEEARLQHVGRPQPLARRQRRERVGDGKRPIAVEHIVGVEVDAEPVAI